MSHCDHPTRSIMYHSEYDEDDDLYEEYWCATCNCWVPDGFMEQIKLRPDWNGGTPEELNSPTTPEAEQ